MLVRQRFSAAKRTNLHEKYDHLVEGSGGITVAAEVQFSNMDSVSEGRAVCLLGLNLHFLTQGATFNLHTRQADAGALNLPKN